ncbi:MAG TPA: sugar transferase [Candidatus Acidoferrales bacterium]|nr:sugar transferase [Candidatus Acidoferrales bacterium]
MRKRLFDFVIALFGIILLSPLFICVAILIKCGAPDGPILYRNQRIGRWGKPFWFLKFRTMVVNADTIGGPSTPANDPRVSRVGAILRRYKLDELPQLFNVLRGEMSIVGPRPEVPQYAALLTEKQKAILSVPPGITDLATLWNSDEGSVLASYSDPEQAYLEFIRPRKIALQLEYVNRHSLRMDLVILLRTLATIVFRSTHRPASSSVEEPRVFGDEFE